MTSDEGRGNDKAEPDVGLLLGSVGDELHESGLEGLVGQVLVHLLLVGVSGRDLLVAAGGAEGGALVDPRELGEEAALERLAHLLGHVLVEDEHDGRGREDLSRCCSVE